MSDTPRTDAILALLPGGQSCDPQAVADDLRPEIARLERELEQERQDRKQADLDTIRALGERNDARKALEQERQLADRLASVMFGCAARDMNDAYEAWEAARNE